MSAAVLAALEEATEGSEDLDRLIYEAMGAEEFFDCTYCDSDMPPFSTSLDASLTLVPEGWGRRLGNGESGWPSPEVPETVALFHHSHGGFDVQASTLPLAVCIAAIRACARSGKP